MLPWATAAWRYPLEFSSVKAVAAVNLLTLVPLVLVHSSDLTVQRALKLYPLDDCKHNKEMSWQTHLGLVLADNMVDGSVVKNAVLKVFENGSRRAFPAQFRGGNYLYFVAFHYHFGEFARGRELLARLLKQNPEVVRYYLNLRPGFIYLNRERLWDDICELYPVAAEKVQLKGVVESLKKQAANDRYCLRFPEYARPEVRH